MSGAGPAGGFLSLALLRHSRALLRNRRNRGIAIAVGMAYALVAMTAGAMLVISPSTFQVESYIAVIAGGSPWWNYPAILVETPYFVLVLPFFSTLVMVLLSAGVGIGMTVAGLLVAELVRARRTRPRGVAGVSISGLSPALITLLTLGACCSTTAGASAGLALVAAVTGATVVSTLANSWYLGFIQLTIVWFGLFAQEQLVVVYRGLSGEREDPPPVDTAEGA